jgi:hypothetical protein
MRPYRKYVKKGFLFTKQNNEFSVDFVSIEDNHFNDGYKDWEECDKCFGDGCDVCDFQGSVETNIKHTNYIDHIVIMKRSTYDKDEKLSEHTIININNKNIVVF